MGAAIVRALRGRPATPRVWLTDAAIAVVLAAIDLSLVRHDGVVVWDLQAPGPRTAAILVLVHLPLLWRSQAPLPVFLVTAVALEVAWVTDPDVVAGWALIGAAHGVGAWAPLVRGGGGLLAIVTAWSVPSLWTAADPLDELRDVLTFVALLGTSWGVGRVGGWQRERAEAGERDHERRVRVAAERDLAEDRARMARELHDVLAHSISVMVVQAAGAREVLDRDPGRAADALGHIDATGRQGLVEVRRLVGLLPGGSSRAPDEPGLARLDDVAARLREAGVAVRVTQEGPPVPLPPSLDLVAFRVAQEALTNVLKHAPRARAALRLAWSPEHLVIEVRDDGAGARPAGATGRGGGRGLSGMRDRVRSVGGDLVAGPDPAGGFAVHATLPLDAAAPAPAPVPGQIPEAHPQPRPAAARRAAADPRAPPAGSRTGRTELAADAALALLAVGLEVLNLLPFSRAFYERTFLMDTVARLEPLPVAALAVIAAPVLWRRRAPLPALAAVTALAAGLGVALGLPLSWWASWPVLSVVAARYPGRVSLPAAAAVSAVGVATLVASGYAGRWTLLTALSYPPWFLVPWVLGRRHLARRRRAEGREAEARERSLRARAGERSRVARELHDVLERSLDAMVGHARAASALLPADRPAAAAALAEVERAGRSGMVEVRRLLSLLDDAQADLSPQPGLGRLDDLVDRARLAGTAVTVRTVAFQPPGDPSVDVFAYRIVEEALANAVRHAPGSPVTVVLAGGDGRRPLEVVDRGARRPGPEPAGAGRGLAAMRERAELVGGTLQAGPTRRGFAVRAELPLRAR